MLEEAAKTGAYRHLINTNEIPLPEAEYPAVTAIGVIGSGAAPPDLFDTCLAALAPGGLFCFSFNDHTLDLPEYTGKLDAALADGRVQVVTEELGDHIRDLGSRSKVYVLRRT
jgi:hypothetical protein